MPCHRTRFSGSLLHLNQRFWLSFSSTPGTGSSRSDGNRCVQDDFIIQGGQRITASSPTVFHQVSCIFHFVAQEGCAYLIIARYTRDSFPLTLLRVQKHGIEYTLNNATAGISVRFLRLGALAGRTGSLHGFLSSAPFMVRCGDAVAGRWRILRVFTDE